MIRLSDFGYNILQIETYGLCNMECGFCPYPLKSKDEKISKLDTNVVKKAIDEIDPNDENFKYVTFSQFNEPLLDNRIFEFVKYAKDKNFQVYFITNGLLLDKKNTVENLINLNPVIKISLQILDDSKHKIGRGLNLELQKYLNKIVNFIEKVKETNLNVTIDVGSNFNDKKLKSFLKKILGLSTGDPNIPYTSHETLSYLLKYFDQFVDKKNNKKIFDVNQKVDPNYLSQEGIKITDRISIKIKHFAYGNRIKDFQPINNNFACDNFLLGIQSSGEVVPCCLAYDSSISMGNIAKQSLKDILENSSLLKNLRIKGGSKHLTCRKCFGEPTKRGAIIRNFINIFK